MCSDNFEAKININVHFYVTNVMDPTGGLLSPKPLCVDCGVPKLLKYTMVWHDSVRSSLYTYVYSSHMLGPYYTTERTTVKYIVWWASSINTYAAAWRNKDV